MATTVKIREIAETNFDNAMNEFWDTITDNVDNYDLTDAEREDVYSIVAEMIRKY